MLDVTGCCVFLTYMDADLKLKPLCFNTGNPWYQKVKVVPLSSHFACRLSFGIKQINTYVHHNDAWLTTIPWEA